MDQAAYALFLRIQQTLAAVGDCVVALHYTQVGQASTWHTVVERESTRRAIVDERDWQDYLRQHDLREAPPSPSSEGTAG